MEKEGLYNSQEGKAARSTLDQLVILEKISDLPGGRKANDFIDDFTGNVSEDPQTLRELNEYSKELAQNDSYWQMMQERLASIRTQLQESSE